MAVQHRGDGSGIGAPRDALPSLGLLHDPLLFDQQNTLIRPRLEQNISMMALLRDRSTGQMEGVRKRLARSLEKSKGNADLKSRLKTYEKLQKLRRSPNTDALSSVALEEALKVFAPPPAPPLMRLRQPTKIRTKTAPRPH